MLKRFLVSHSDRPWAPGNVDCCLVLADWAMELGHVDPADHLRGAYRDEEGFFAIIEKSGGVVPLVGSCVEKLGVPVDRPELGDIGVVGSPLNIRRQFGAIYDGSRWLVRNRNGFLPLTARLLASWRLVCLN